jgi:hypothetical protein
MGHSRRFDSRPLTSGLPSETDVIRPGLHVSNVPSGLMQCSNNRLYSITSSARPSNDRGLQSQASRDLCVSIRPSPASVPGALDGHS